jgi:Zn-dependent peptidase ImmA (M78 family)
MTNDTLIDIFNNLTTYNPFEICEQQNISVLIEPLGTVKGYYCQLHDYPFVFISTELDDYEKKLVCAHELGHALLHPEINLFYTVFPVEKYERQANNFAVNLLLMESKEDYPDYDLYQLAQVAGIPKSLLEAAYEHIVI